MNREPETFSAGETLAETARAHLKGWRIPEGIPLNPDTAILPLRPDPDMLRTASRVLHTLLVRTCPNSIVVIGSREVGGPKPAVIASGSLHTALGPVGIDRGRAARVSASLRGAIDMVPSDQLLTLAPSSGFDTIPILLQVLAPGCRVLPILIAKEGLDPEPAAAGFSPGDLGRLLADLFAKDSVVVAAALELSSADPEETSPRDQLRVRDAELMRPLLALELDEADRVAASGRVSAPAVLAVALAHAKARGATEGHLIEYVRSAGQTPEDAWTGRAGIIF